MATNSNSRDPDVRLAWLAGNQAGAFNRTDAMRLGFTRWMIEHRLRTGIWTQLAQDVFLLAGFTRDWNQRCWAATLEHPAAAVSHKTSAVRLGLESFRPGRVHTAVPPTAAHLSRIAVVHRSRHTQFTLVNGLRTTTFAQTMVQLAENQPDDAIRTALRSGIEARPARCEELHQRLGELHGRRLPGFRRLVDQLDEVDGEPPTASELERVLFSLLRDVPDMPTIERQAEMPWSPTRRTLVDGVVWPWRLIIEADGRRWHTRVEDFERDRWRDNEAAIAGFYVMRFAYRHIVEDPDGVLDQVRRYGRRFSARPA